MAKISKCDAAKHLAAMALLGKDDLTLDERWQILQDYREDATHLNGTAGAFFTPFGLARDLVVEIPTCRRIVDLCAGIGTLAFAAQTACRDWTHGTAPEIVCIENNPEYVAVGRKILPQATWIEASVFDADTIAQLGRFDVAISNPPFGAIRCDGAPRRYRGSDFEFRVLDVASDIAEYGVFVVPQMSAPFSYSGQRTYTETRPARYDRFEAETGIVLEPNCGLDTSIHRGEWHGVAPVVEIVCADFMEARCRRAPAQRSLFDAAA